MEVSVKDARSRLSALLDQVQMGGKVTILRHGKEVARLVPPGGEGKPLPSLKEFRDSIMLTGGTLRDAVIRGREEERY